VIDTKGFDIALYNGKALIMTIGYISDKSTVFGVRERNLYRLRGQLMRPISSNIVIDSMEHVAPKVEKLRESHHLGSSGKEHPSKSIKKDSWYEMDMQDSQEKETSRIIFRGNESLEIGHSIMEGITSMS
jgi:hypothetical protein